MRKKETNLENGKVVKEKIKKKNWKNQQQNVYHQKNKMKKKKNYYFEVELDHICSVSLQRDLSFDESVTIPNIVNL